MQHTQDHVSQTLRSAEDPTALVLGRLYRHAFGLGQQDDPYQSESYRHLKNLHPVRVGNEYKGDAVEFMMGSLQGGYLALQELVERLAESVEAKPFAGEHITAFIERVAETATRQMLEANQ